MKFPLDLMPKCIRDAAEGIALYTNAPPELPVMIALGEASLAVQGLYNATAHRFDSPTSLFIMVLNRSGGLKSQISKFLNRGRKRYEDMRLPIYENLMSEYKAEYRSWELEKGDAAKEKDPMLRRQMLTQVQKEEPVPPVYPKRLVEDVTNVGLYRAFEHRGPSIGMFSTDAGAFLSGNTMADGARSKEIMTKLAKLWSGEEINRLTGEEQKDYYNRRASILWLVQGVMAEDFLSSPAFQGQGILARMLVVPIPAYVTPPANYADDDAVDGRGAVEQACNAFNTRIYELLMRDLATKGDDSHEIDAPVFPWSKDAKRLQQDWVNGYCAQYRNGQTTDEDDTNRSYYERLEEHAARLATVFAVVDGEGCVSTDHAIAAHRLVEWLTEQRQKFDDSATTDNDEHRAFEALRRWLVKRSGETVKLSALLRSGPRAFRQASERVREAAMRRADMENLLTFAVETAGNGLEVPVVQVK